MTPDPFTVSPETSLDDALQMMDDEDIRHLVVVEGETVVGVVSDRDLYTAIGWLPAPGTASRADGVRPPRPVGPGHPGKVGDVMHRDPTTGAPDETVVTASVDLVLGRIGCLPVLDGQRLVGIVTEMDLLAAYWRTCRQHRLAGDVDPPARAHMHRDPTTVQPGTPLLDAVALCRAHHIRHLPVLDDGELVGMLSDRDLRAAHGEGVIASQTCADVMASAVVSAEPDDRLSQAAELMVRHKCSALPIVEGERLVGILSLRDVLDHCMNVLREPEPQRRPGR